MNQDNHWRNTPMKKEDDQDLPYPDNLLGRDRKSEETKALRSSNGENKGIKPLRRSEMK